MTMTYSEHYDNAVHRAIDEYFFVAQLDEETYTVLNLTNNRQYFVEVKDDLILSCTCEHYLYRGPLVCKHQARTQMEFPYLKI